MHSTQKVETAFNEGLIELICVEWNLLNLIPNFASKKYYSTQFNPNSTQF